MPDRRNDEPFVFPFFVGAGRSGTTLVRAIFNAHPDMAVPDESNFVSVLARMRARYDGSDGFAASLFLNDLFEQRRFRRWRLSKDDVQIAFDHHPPTDLAEAIRTVFALYARRNGKTRYGDKTPSYVLHVSLLADLFPESRFIHVIRDGRDVALSMLDVDFGPRSIGGAAQLWKAHVTAGRDAGHRLGPSRYQEIRYEELLDDPEAAVTSLCGFIDLPFDPDMLRYFERSETITSPSAWSRRHLVLPPTKGLRDWRGQMPEKDVALFDVLAGDLLTQLGYERTTDRPRTTARIRARAEVFGRQLRLLTHRSRKARADGERGQRPTAPTSFVPNARHDRQEVMSLLVAGEAATEPDVVAFRERELTNRLLRLDEVTDWVSKQAAKDEVSDGERRHAVTLEYLGVDPWPLRQPTIEGGVLDTLCSLSSMLTHVYGWQRCQASTFVLTGLPPMVDAIRSQTVGGIPLSCTTRIVLEVDPAVTASDVMKHYSLVRDRLAAGRFRPISERDLELAEFVAEHPDQDRPHLMRLWNNQFPRWSYDDEGTFHHDAVRARRSILDPPW